MKIVIKVIAITMLMACASGVYYLSGWGGSPWGIIGETVKEATKPTTPATNSNCDCLTNGYCDGKDLTGCNLDHKVLHSLRGANLSGLTLSWVDFSDADLTDANLSNATINPGVTFTRARLINTNLKGIKINPATWNAPVANFNYANLTGAKIDFNTFKSLYNAGALKGALWPDTQCMDNRCGGDVLNKKTVILSSIDNQSDKDYIIVTTNAPVDELRTEIGKSKEGTSQFKDWFMPKYGVQSFYNWFNDTSKNMYGDAHGFTFSTGKTYSFRICGDFIDDAPLIAKAHTLSTYPIPGSNNTFPDLSSKNSPTGTTTQTIILLPTDFQYKCEFVHLIGRSDDNFTVYTYGIYNEVKPCAGIQEKRDADAFPGKPLKADKIIKLGQGGKLSLVINAKRYPTSLKATED